MSDTLTASYVLNLYNNFFSELYIRRIRNVLFCNLFIIIAEKEDSYSIQKTKKIKILFRLSWQFFKNTI